MKKLLLFYCCVIAGVTGCKKTINFQSPQLASYVPAQSGKTITYRLDSTNFINFGTVETVTSYLAQDVVDSMITDNLGRPSWRVFRYITDTLESQPWVNAETYMITPTSQDVEVVENNLRYIKLVLPVVSGFSWPGNSYIDTNSPDTSLDYDYSYLANWTYVYQSVGATYNVLAGAIPSTLLVHQQDTTYGDSTNAAAYSERDYSIEVYASGIGLIYKDFLHWEYQPPNGTNSSGYKVGYGIRLNMVSHN